MIMDYDTLYNLVMEELDGSDGSIRISINFTSKETDEDEVYIYEHQYITRIWEVDSEEEGRTIYVFKSGDLIDKSNWEQDVIDYYYTMSDAIESALEEFDGWLSNYEECEIKKVDSYLDEEFKELKSLIEAKFPNHKIK